MRAGADCRNSASHALPAYRFEDNTGHAIKNQDADRAGGALFPYGAHLPVPELGEVATRDADSGLIAFTNVLQVHVEVIRLEVSEKEMAAVGDLSTSAK